MWKSLNSATTFIVFNIKLSCCITVVCRFDLCDDSFFGGIWRLSFDFKMSFCFRLSSRPLFCVLKQWFWIAWFLSPQVHSARFNGILKRYMCASDDNLLPPNGSILPLSRVNHKKYLQTVGTRTDQLTIWRACKWVSLTTHNNNNSYNGLSYGNIKIKNNYSIMGKKWN